MMKLMATAIAAALAVSAAVAVHAASGTFVQDVPTAESAKAIRPFHVHVSDVQLDDLRRRIAATRWPDKEKVADRSQGAQLEQMQ